MPSRRRVLAGSVGLLAPLAGCTGERDPETNGTTEGTTTPPGTATTPPGTGATTDTPDTATNGDSGLAGPWPTFRGDAANTGVVAASGPTTDPSVGWRVRTRIDGDACPMPAPEGAYAPSGDGHLYALTDGGDERWRAEIGRRPWTPAVDDGRVVVPTRDALTAFAPDGEVRWRYDGERFFQQPAFLDGTVVAGRFGGGAVLVDASDGSLVGRVGEASRAYEPVVRDGTAYVALRNQRDRAGAVVAVASDGSVRWRAEMDDSATSRVGVGDGTVYAGTNEGYVYAFDAATGEENWRTSVGDWVTRGPTVADGRAFAVTLDRGVVALDRDGDVQWRAPDVNASTDPVAVGGRLLTDHADREVVALDPADGSFDWRLPVDGQLHQGVRAVGDRVVAGTATGTVHEIDPGTGEERWRFTTKPRRFPSPVVGRRFAYLGGRSGYTTGIVLDKGKGKWSVRHPAWSPDAPAVVDVGVESADGNSATESPAVVSGSWGGDLNATEAHDYPDVPAELTPTPTDERGTTVHVDPAPPEELWATALDASVRSSVTYADGTAVVGTDDGLAAVGIHDGQVRWRAGRAAPVESTPAVADGVVVAGANDGIVAAHSVEDGTERWTAATGDAVVSSPAVRDGAAHVGSDDGSLYAFDIADGAVQWEFETGGPVVSSPAVTSSVAVVGSADGNVYAIDAERGERRWTVETGGPVYSSPAIAGDTVYVGSRDGHLYALALSDGGERWRFEAQNWVDSSPAVGFGAVFVADQGGNVYALVD